jgi:hypothetical protein
VRSTNVTKRREGDRGCNTFPRIPSGSHGTGSVASLVEFLALKEPTCSRCASKVYRITSVGNLEARSSPVYLFPI